MTKRAAIYTRVSTEEQAERGFSLQTQEEACRRYCEERGWTVIEVYREEGVSGATLDRPQLDALRDAIEAGRVDAVVVYDQDRLSRNAGQYLLLREEWERRNMELHFVQTGHAESDEDRLMETIRAGIAEYERAKIAERSRRNIRGRVKAGSTIVYGHPPYGYAVEKQDNGLYRLVIDEDEARIVRLVYAWYTQGDGESGPLSIHAITLRLSSVRVPTRADNTTSVYKVREAGLWTPSVVGGILGKEVYAGRWFYGKAGKVKGRQVRNPRDTWIAVEVPAIVDRETWEAVQQRRRENKDTARRNAKYPYLLRRRVTCGSCGYKMQGCTATHRTPTISYYRCPVSDGSYPGAARSCHGPRFRADLVDVAVWSWLKDLLSDPVNLQRNLQGQQAEREKEVQPLRERLSIAEDLLADHRRQLEKLLDLYLTGDFVKDVLLERRARLEEAITRLGSERAGLQAHLAEQVLTDEQVQTIEALAAQVRLDLALTDTAAESFGLEQQIVDLLDVRTRLCVEEGEKVAHVRCVIDARRLLIVSTTASSNVHNEQLRPVILTTRIVLQPGLACNPGRLALAQACLREAGSVRRCNDERTGKV